jgi:cytochrome c biogenesis protein CcmG/thiol:disulfide interchange protein DsbE
VSPRRILIALGAVAVVALVAIGLSQSKGIDEQKTHKTAEEMTRELAGAPPRLAEVYAQANELLPGNATTVKRRIASLKGYPVVVNMWGSWCGPCRLEMPFFQTTAVQYGKKVAFLGLNVEDSVSDARKLLDEIPLPYPSYKDLRGTTGTDVAGTIAGLPITVFYDAQGKRQQIHQGVFASQKELATAVRRYALGEHVAPAP